MSGEAHHFTCGHGAEGIIRDGVIRPNWHPLLPEPLAWFTDLAEPMRIPLGLTSYLLRCDRTEYRFDIARLADLEYWPRYCRRIGLPREARSVLEEAPGAMPAHWWVSTTPVAPIAAHPVRWRAAS